MFNLLAGLFLFMFLKMWEKAIQLSKELAEMYENKVFDYEGLGSLLVRSVAFNGRNEGKYPRGTKKNSCHSQH